MTTHPTSHPARPVSSEDSTLLIAALIRARRLELGLSERTVAAALGVSQSIVRGLEAGTNHKDLTLGEIAQLADILGMTLTDLLRSPAAQTDEHAADQGVDRAQVGLSGQLGALLWEVDRLIPIEALAETTGATLADVEAALGDLDRLLEPAGLLVHRLNNQVKIWRRIDKVSRETLRATWRAHLARRGMDIGQSNLLGRVLAGRKTKMLSNDDEVTTRELVNAATLTRGASGGVELSADARFSLLFEDPTS